MAGAGAEDRAAEDWYIIADSVDDSTDGGSMVPDCCWSSAGGWAVLNGDGNIGWRTGDIGTLGEEGG